MRPLDAGSERSERIATGRDRVGARLSRHRERCRVRRRLEQGRPRNGRRVPLAQARRSVLHRPSLRLPRPGRQGRAQAHLVTMTGSRRSAAAERQLPPAKSGGWKHVFGEIDAGCGGLHDENPFEAPRHHLRAESGREPSTPSALGDPGQDGDPRCSILIITSAFRPFSGSGCRTAVRLSGHLP